MRLLALLATTSGVTLDAVKENNILHASRAILEHSWLARSYFVALHVALIWRSFSISRDNVDVTVQDTVHQKLCEQLFQIFQRIKLLDGSKFIVSFGISVFNGCRQDNRKIISATNQKFRIWENKNRTAKDQRAYLLPASYVEWTTSQSFQARRE